MMLALSESPLCGGYLSGKYTNGIKRERDRGRDRETEKQRETERQRKNWKDKNNKDVNCKDRNTEIQRVS
jgi:aryl-alcohol dehydrogenase-like predicted oxidoreductase